MKRNGAAQKKPIGSMEEIPQQAELNTSRMQTVSYAKNLRALGQALEERKITSLELELESGNYVIRGKAQATKAAERSFAKMIRDLIYRAGVPLKRESDFHQIDLRYSPMDIELFEYEGRAKRKASNKLPDPFSLSQVLRGAGYYLDKRKETTLVGITIIDQKVTIRYKTAEGRVKQAKHDLEYFYDYWVKKYLRRSNQPKRPPPSAPTLIVTWEGLKHRQG